MTALLLAETRIFLKSKSQKFSLNFYKNTQKIDGHCIYIFEYKIEKYLNSIYISLGIFSFI